jgi:hypothetical protein
VTRALTAAGAVTLLVLLSGATRPAAPDWDLVCPAGTWANVTMTGCEPLPAGGST